MNNSHEPQAIFFMVSALVTYMREDQPKSRHINLLAQLEDPNITAEILGQLNQSAIQRVASENGVEPGAVKDVVFLGFFPMGMMTPSEFHGTKPNPGPGPGRI